MLGRQVFSFRMPFCLNLYLCQRYQFTRNINLTDIAYIEGPVTGNDELASLANQPSLWAIKLSMLARWSSDKHTASYWYNNNHYVGLYFEM